MGPVAHMHAFPPQHGAKGSYTPNKPEKPTAVVDATPVISTKSWPKTGRTLHLHILGWRRTTKLKMLSMLIAKEGYHKYLDRS